MQSGLFYSFPQVLGANAVGHVMAGGCRRWLGGREQNQRPSAQPGITVLTTCNSITAQPLKHTTHSLTPTNALSLDHDPLKILG